MSSKAVMTPLPPAETADSGKKSLLSARNRRCLFTFVLRTCEDDKRLVFNGEKNENNAL